MNLGDLHGSILTAKNSDGERECRKCGFTWREPSHGKYQSCPNCD